MIYETVNRTQIAGSPFLEDLVAQFAFNRKTACLDLDDLQAVFRSFVL